MRNLDANSTPVLWKRLSVKSGGVWHAMQFASAKSWKPTSSSAVNAVRSPSRRRSIGASLEMIVASNAAIARDNLAPVIELPVCTSIP